MADYSSGAIYFTGLGNGTDFDSIIEVSVQAKSYRLEQYQDKLEAYETKQEYLQELNNSMLELNTVLDSLDSTEAFMTKEAVSSSDAVSVTADGDALEGVHTVSVDQLAQNDVWINSGTGHADSSEVVAASNASFSYSYAGQEYTLDVAAGTTLSGLVSLINSNPDTSGDVRAALVNDGSSYHLQLYGMDLGADNTVAVTASTISGYAPADFENTQTAQNARFKIDGYPTAADQWMERSTNVIDDAVDGLTLTLRDTVDDATISVAVDNDAVKQNVVDLVEALNSVFTMIDQLTAVDEEGTASAFTGNYAVRMAKNSLKNGASGMPPGFSAYDADTGTGNFYSALSQIGITTDADQDSATFGQLIIDETELDEALDDDPDAVAMLFAADGHGTTDSADFSFVSVVEGITAPGDHEVEYQVSGGTIVSATIDGQAAIIDGLEITADADTDASGLTVRVDNLADGTYSGQVSILQGVAARLNDLVDAMTATDGTIQIMDDGYDAQIASLEDNIADEEDRLETYEANLRERYATLEATLSSYESINSALEDAISELD